jgi:hypothetical protein
MSTTAATSHRSHAGKVAKKPFWKRDLGDLGKGGDEEVEHPAFEPALPRVDVLPDQVRESILLRKVRRGIIALAAVLAVALGALWYLPTSDIQNAQAQLALAQVDNSQLQASEQALIPVQEMFTQITAQQELVRRTLASQPKSAAVIEHLLADGQKAGGKTAITFNEILSTYQGVPIAGGNLNPCPKPDPFVVDVTVGCLTFSATAESREQVTALLDALEADPFFVGPFISATTANVDQANGKLKVSFTGTAGIAPAALKSPLSPEQIDALIAPPAPSPSPTSGA